MPVANNNCTYTFPAPQPTHSAVAKIISSIIAIYVHPTVELYETNTYVCDELFRAATYLMVLFLPRDDLEYQAPLEERCF